MCVCILGLITWDTVLLRVAPRKVGIVSCISCTYSLNGEISLWMYVRIEAKYLLFSRGFNRTWTWSSGSFKNVQRKIPWKSVRTLRSFSVWSEGRADRGDETNSCLVKILRRVWNVCFWDICVIVMDNQVFILLFFQCQQFLSNVHSTNTICKLLCSKERHFGLKYINNTACLVQILNTW